MDSNSCYNRSRLVIENRSHQLCSFKTNERQIKDPLIYPSPIALQQLVPKRIHGAVSKKDIIIQSKSCSLPMVRKKKADTNLPKSGNDIYELVRLNIFHVQHFN